MSKKKNKVIKRKPKSKVNISSRVFLPIHLDNPNPEFVPSSLKFENNKSMVEQIAVAINKRLPILLIGETGTGKTSVIRHLANKTSNCFRRVNHSGGTTVDDIKGKILINEKGTYWIDGVLIEAMRKGWWYLADEINAASAEINFVYHSLLDDDGFVVLEEHNGEVVRPHPNFRFFAAMNPMTEYAGTKELNKALLSRFVVVKTDFPSPSTEEKILVTRTGIDSEVAKKMIKFASDIRTNHIKGKSEFILSTRELLLWAGMFNFYKKYIPSAEMTILNKVAPEDFESIKDLLSLNFSGLDNPKLKVENKSEVEKEDQMPF